MNKLLLLMVVLPSSLLTIIAQINCKYIQGEIHTNDNWAFLARFCFLSEDGQFEYDIEFNEEQGTPNLLLYYDTSDQWPAVYKSNKNCEQRERVLHLEQNQIVNLTTKNMYASGCSYYNHLVPTRRTTTTTINPPKRFKSKLTTTTTTTTTSVAPPPETTSTNSSITSTSTEQSTDFNNYYDDLSSITSPISTSSDLLLEDFSYTTATLLPKISTIEDITMSDIELDLDNNNPPIKKRSLILPVAPPHSFKTTTTTIRSIINSSAGKRRMINCHNARRFRSSRERWWFIAVSNCNGNKGIHLKYRILMTNGEPGDYWHEHFSADEFYIMPILMAVFIAYAFLLLAIVVCSIELKSRQLLHTTYKIFVCSVIFQLFGILLQTVTNLKYAISGFRASGLQRLGAIYMGASETCFLLLLLLLAKGFTITRGRLPLNASIKLTIFMCVYVVTFITLFIYEAQVFDPGEVLYLYESPAGYGLICLRIIAWCMFIYSTIFTLKHYPEKSNFYYPFNICGTLWFIAGPAFILSANTYIDKWVRESVVCAVLQFITFSGHFMFLVLTMPSVANKNFPYHVRTTQIGVMELTGGGSTIEQFGHHVYEPSAATIRDQAVIIPLTRRTEEIFEGMYNCADVMVPNNYQQQRLNTTTNSQQELLLMQQQQQLAIDNVLNWSMAKNVRALELPTSNGSSINSRLSSSSVEGGRSVDDDEGVVNSCRTSRRTSELGIVNNNASINGNYQDYVRDVPIELFTISRMVVNDNNNAKQ